MPFANHSHDQAPIDATVSDSQYVWLTNAAGKVSRALVSTFEAGISAAGGVSRVWVPASDFLAYAGSPAMDASTSPNFPGLLFDDATTEAVVAPLDVPRDWLTLDLYFWTQNPTGNTGDIQALCYVYDFADGDTAATVSQGANAAYTVAGTSGVLERHSVGTFNAPVTADSIGRTLFYRAGGDAADTLTGDIALIAIEAVKAT